MFTRTYGFGIVGLGLIAEFHAKAIKAMKKGKLVNVGLGMTLGAHITPLSRNFIEQADVVFVSASNQLVEEWVKTMNDHVIMP